MASRNEARAKCSDGDFIHLIKQFGPHKAAKMLNQNVRSVYRRRDNLEKFYKNQISGPSHQGNTRHGAEHAARLHLSVPDGIVLVGSDAHIWPGKSSTGMRAFLRFCKELKPRAVVMNGDVMDFPQVSRHPPIGWENHPTVADEIEAAKDQLHEIELATAKSCKLVWTLGNHDGRFETRLATVAPEYARLNGFHLKDYFPNWSPCWSVWINDDVVVKHRFKGGDHAPFNNTVKSGKTMVTGHLHSAKVTPYSDYNGDRYGVDTGCLADPNHPAFTDYTEDNPKNWRSGFGVFTFRGGKLLQPELCLVVDDKHVQFRGEIIGI